jgi:hypothetical protein
MCGHDARMKSLLVELARDFDRFQEHRVIAHFAPEREDERDQKAEQQQRHDPGQDHVDIRQRHQTEECADRDRRRSIGKQRCVVALRHWFTRAHWCSTS